MASLTASALTLARPVWLVALAAAALPVVAAWRARRRGRRVPALAVAAQCLALAAVAVALARPRARLSWRAALPYLLLVDASGSVRGQQQLAGQLRFPRGAEVERFDFAAGLTRVTAPAPSRTDGGSGQADETSLAPALQLIGSRGRGGIAAAVIVTDGRFTDAGWESAAEGVAAGGVELYLVPQNAPPADARIVALSARRSAAGKVEITVSVSSNAPVARRLSVSRSGRAEPLLVKPLSLLGDAPATVRLSDDVPGDASAEYLASLGGEEVVTENDSAAVLVLPVRQKVAAVGLEPPARVLLGGLSLPVTFLSPGELADGRSGLAEFSAIVLADATGTAFTPAQRRAVGEYVRGGGGLVMIGAGPHEKPADQHDPLNQVLPLLPNPFQRRPLALRVLLDRSGSMSRPAVGAEGAERIKFDLAAEAVVALKDHLTPRDTLAVIAFADRPEVVYDSGAGPADFAALRAALRGVRPTGSTKVVPAIDAALKSAAPAAPSTRPAVPPPARTPMLLVLSDLQTEDFDARQWAGRIDQAGARLAVVAVGKKSPLPAAAPPLEVLVRLLEGRASYQRRDDLGGLAKVFAALVRRSRGEAVRRGPARLLVVAPLFDASLEALPDVDAYVLAAQHPDAELLARTEGGDAILARRQAGLGRTVGLALPVAGGDNPAWRADPQAASLLASAVRWALRGANDPRFDARLVRRGETLGIIVTAGQDGRPLDQLGLSAAVVAGDATPGAELRQTAPGEYEGEVACPGDVPAAVVVRDEAGAAVWRGSAAALYPVEYRNLGADQEALRRLARLTGGRIVPADRLAETIRQSYRRRMTDLWPWLLAAALLAVLAEWSLTRVTRR